MREVMADLLERLFPDLGQAETASLLVVLALISVGVWLGRKRLRTAIPVAVVVLLLSAVAIPSWLPSRPYAHRAACINNLKVIAQAKAEWATANNKQPGDVPMEKDLFRPDLKLKVMPTCPSGGTYSLGAIGEKPRCSLESRGHKLE